MHYFVNQLRWLLSFLLGIMILFACGAQSEPAITEGYYEPKESTSDEKPMRAASIVYINAETGAVIDDAASNGIPIIVDNAVETDGFIVYGGEMDVTSSYENQILQISGDAKTYWGVYKELYFPKAKEKLIIRIGNKQKSEFSVEDGLPFIEVSSTKNKQAVYFQETQQTNQAQVPEGGDGEIIYPLTEPQNIWDSWIRINLAFAPGTYRNLFIVIGFE